jgi:hypothetical protein
MSPREGLGQAAKAVARAMEALTKAEEGKGKGKEQQQAVGVMWGVGGVWVCVCS